MTVGGQLYAPAALPPLWKSASDAHCIGRWVGPRAGLEAVAKRKIPSPTLPGMEPGRPAHNLVTILTKLSHPKYFTRLGLTYYHYGVRNKDYEAPHYIILSDMFCYSMFWVRISSSASRHQIL